MKTLATRHSYGVMMPFLSSRASLLGVLWELRSPPHLLRRRLIVRDRASFPSSSAAYFDASMSCVLQISESLTRAALGLLKIFTLGGFSKVTAPW
jgi:hypothetical protein